MQPDGVNYCIRCGALLEPKERAGKMRPACSSCDWVFFPDPKVAAGVLIFKDSKILLVRRVNSPKKGYWTLPVGFIDAGEEPSLAAVRECKEETGLTIRIVKLLDVFTGKEHPQGSHILILYKGEILEGELLAGDDVDKAGFFSRDNLPPLAFTTTRIIIDRFCM
jgi:ADP-ribose pyrophosphatase YjhB (NUDIX family)